MLLVRPYSSTAYWHWPLVKLSFIGGWWQFNLWYQPRCNVLKTFRSLSYQQWIEIQLRHLWQGDLKAIQHVNIWCWVKELLAVKWSICIRPATTGSLSLTGAAYKASMQRKHTSVYAYTLNRATGDNPAAPRPGRDHPHIVQQSRTSWSSVNWVSTVNSNKDFRHRLWLHFFGRLSHSMQQVAFNKFICLS